MSTVDTTYDDVTRSEAVPRDHAEFFSQTHDPTTKDRQGNDIGSAYRSEIFYTSDEQREVAEDTIADVEASGLWSGKVVTEISAAGPALGGRGRAPGLPPAHPKRLHVPLPAAGLELPHRETAA